MKRVEFVSTVFMLPSPHFNGDSQKINKYFFLN